MEGELPPLNTLPNAVSEGSIEITDNNADITDFLELADVSLDEAIHTARAALPEPIAGVTLASSAGYLVWQITLVRGKDQGAVLMIDTGSGRLLALKPLTSRQGWWRHLRRWLAVLRAGKHSKPGVEPGR